MNNKDAVYAFCLSSSVVLDVEMVGVTDGLSCHFLGGGEVVVLMVMEMVYLM